MGVRCCNGVPVECGDVWRHPVARGEESASGASEGLGADRFSQGRGRGKCRHCLSFHSTNL